MEYLLPKMHAEACGLQCSDLILEWRISGGANQVRGAGARELAGAKDAARASRPSWRFKLRRAPAKSSSKPAMARTTHAASTIWLSDSSSLARGAFRRRGSLTFDVS